MLPEAVPVSLTELSATVAAASGISRDHLRAHVGPLADSEAQIVKISIAEKMSWAAQRTTTRIEDLAYCLLGLFDLNIPVLYGEGHRAFQRLQQEIVRASNDQSIFAWSNMGRYRSHSVFAEPPA